MPGATERERWLSLARSLGVQADEAGAWRVYEAIKRQHQQRWPDCDPQTYQADMTALARALRI